MSLHNSEDEDKTIYKVVVNHEEQYSIWPEYKDNPLGWNDVGKVGPKPECLEYIKEVWTDMRPLSLRKKMEEIERNPPVQEVPDGSGVANRESLVERLCKGEHPLEVSLRPAPTAKGLKEAIDKGYVRIKFTDTKGGSELGLRLNMDACDLSGADFETGSGKARISGELSLDYTKVHCIADIDLGTFAGQGHLEKVEIHATSG